jgi:hypothetical protein
MNRILFSLIAIAALAFSSHAAAGQVPPDLDWITVVTEHGEYKFAPDDDVVITLGEVPAWYLRVGHRLTDGYGDEMEIIRVDRPNAPQPQAPIDLRAFWIDAPYHADDSMAGVLETPPEDIEIEILHSPRWVDTLLEESLCPMDYTELLRW